MNKLMFYMLAGCAVVMMAGSASAASPLRIGFSAEPYPPFTVKRASGKWTGFTMDITSAICAHLDRPCREVPTAWSGIIPALETGKIDMILDSMTVTPAREKKIDFTKPYYVTHLDYVAPKNMHVKIPQGLKGKFLGVQGGTVAAAYAMHKLAPKGIKIRTYAKQEQLNRDLLAYRVDIMLADSVAMNRFVGLKQANSLEIKGHANRPAQNIAVGIRKGDDQLKHNLNQAIETVLKSGKCTKISKKWLHFDICAKP